MIDWDDSKFTALSTVVLIVIIVLGVMAYRNSRSCAELTCPNKNKPVLMDHRCLCVEDALP